MAQLCLILWSSDHLSKWNYNSVYQKYSPSLSRHHKQAASQGCGKLEIPWHHVNKVNFDSHVDAIFYTNFVVLKSIKLLWGCFFLVYQISSYLFSCLLVWVIHEKRISSYTVNRIVNKRFIDFRKRNHWYKITICHHFLLQMKLHLGNVDLWWWSRLQPPPPPSQAKFSCQS